MLKEVIKFALPLGPGSDEFLKLYREIREQMASLGTQAGVFWLSAAGNRVLLIEREFDSLAGYEEAEAAFHADQDFMALWRRMEELAESMEVELWQTRLERADIEVLRSNRRRTSGEHQ